MAAFRRIIETPHYLVSYETQQSFIGLLTRELPLAPKTVGSQPHLCYCRAITTTLSVVRRGRAPVPSPLILILLKATVNKGSVGNGGFGARKSIQR